MQTTAPALTPAAIMQVGMGFWPSKVLLTAVNKGLFTHLAQRPLSLKEIKTLFTWNCTDRHAADFLDTLVSLKLLNRQGMGDGGLYSNTPETGFFLDKKKPAYMGGILEMANNR